MNAVGLETVWVEVPEDALDAYESALSGRARTVGFFFADEDARIWRVEGVKDLGANEDVLAAGLAVAALVTGVDAVLQREATEPGGWLARTLSTFPEQLVGRRFAVRGTHLTDAPTPGRIVLLLDAGVAFGSGEHGSTRGCLRALERWRIGGRGGSWIWAVGRGFWRWGRRSCCTGRRWRRISIRGRCGWGGRMPG